MRVTWATQRGDPRELAVGIKLVTDPDEGRGADPVMAASWGALSVWAGGVNVTAHSDGQDSHEAVNWYLLPWLEWVAEHWDPIFHEEKLPCRVAGDAAAASLAKTAFPPEQAHTGWEAEWQAWWQRHAIQSARSDEVRARPHVRDLTDARDHVTEATRSRHVPQPLLARLRRRHSSASQTRNECSL